MAKIKFEDGTVVNFDGNPTPQDVEEVANKLGLQKSTETPAPTAVKSSFGQNAAQFFKGEATAAPAKAGFWGSLFQETVGSKGVLGMFQAPARLAKTIIGTSVAKKISAAQQQLLESANKLRAQALTLPAGSQGARDLLQWAKETEGRAGIISQPLPEIRAETTTPQEMAAIGIRGETTLASFALKAPTTLLQATGIGAGMGGAYGLARGIEEKQKPLGVLKETVIGGTIGGATSGTFYLAQKGLEKLGQSLYKSLVRYSNNPKSATDYLVQKEIKLPLSQIEKEVEKDISKYEGMLQTELRDSTEKITKEEIAKGVVKRATEYLEYTGKEDLIPLFKTESIYDDALKALKDVKLNIEIPDEGLSVTQANSFRRVISQRLSDKAWQKSLSELPGTQQDLRGLTDALGEIIKTKVPSTVPVFTDYAPVMAARSGIDALANKLEKRMAITAVDVGLVGIAAFTPATLPQAVGVMVGKRITQTALPSAIGGTSLFLARQIRRMSIPEIQNFLIKAFIGSSK